MDPEENLKEPISNNKLDTFSILENIIQPSQLKQDYLTTGCSAIDEFLCGGIPTFGVTEVTGESASGKTQLCLQLALTAQLPTSLGGLDTEVVYINTEKLFPSKRLNELTDHFIGIYGDLLPDAPMDKVNLEHISDTVRYIFWKDSQYVFYKYSCEYGLQEALLQCLDFQLPNLMRERFGKVRLVIVDSIAAIFRADYGRSEMEKRTNDLRKVGVTLHNLSRNYNAAILVINQVTGKPDSAKSEKSWNASVPSLGLAWANLVTTRLVLSRTKEARLLSVKFAPHIPNGSIPVYLCSEGIRAVLPSFRTKERLNS